MIVAPICFELIIFAPYVVCRWCNNPSQLFQGVYSEESEGIEDNLLEGTEQVQSGVDQRE